MNWKEHFKFLENKKMSWILTISLLLLILFLGIQIRVSGLNNLIDPTTGDYTPLALDPYYFLRVSETLLENKGVLPEVDEMRYPFLKSGWTQEILPQSTVIIYKIMKTFNPETTLRYANVLNPVIFFGLGLIIFFFLVNLLVKNRAVALSATFILSIIPPYLYRTLAGFSDHESIGMFGFFLAILMFSLGLYYLEKRKSSLKISLIFGFVAGIATMFAIASWGGGAKFLFMIIPVAFFADWFIKKNYYSSRNYLVFYSLWILGILVSANFFGFGILQVAKTYMLNSFGLLTFVVLLYLLFEMINYKFKLIGKKYSKYHELIILGAIIIFGSILYQLLIGNIFNLIYDLVLKIVSPFGTGRVGLTVAENRQPYLDDLVSQVGKVFFYTFLAGCFLIGLKISQGIKSKKIGILFFSSFVFFVLGILFSRISPESLFNGVNFISQALVFISFLGFLVVSIYTYKNSSFSVETRWIILAAWMIPMLLGVRSAIRVFFAIVPFLALVVPLAVYELGRFNLKIKERAIRFVGWLAILFLILGLFIAIYGFYESVGYHAENQRPSYNEDWQNSMSWVRENTSESSLFLHWWDYGYWVQTGGQRASVTDGGHFNGYWDHLIGRYVLTTPNPLSAKSFMKTHNVSYLLIDSTDIDKYSAYSTIGNGLEEGDRESWMSSFVSNPEEVKETKNGKVRVYRGGTVLDSDIYYSFNGSEFFLPKYKASIGGMMIEEIDSRYLQPIGVYIYNNKQYNLPIRYLFVNEELIDFGSGVESLVYLYTRIYDSQGKQLIDSGGAAIYLTERTKDSLVAQLYLMNDPEERYSELELVHEESIFPLPFYYNGFRGPIKIWKVGQMENILINGEFLATSGEYGSLDDLEFEK